MKKNKIYLNRKNFPILPKRMSYIDSRDFWRDCNDFHVSNSINGRRISSFSIFKGRVFHRNMMGLSTGYFYGIDKIKFKRKK